MRRVMSGFAILPAGERSGVAERDLAADGLEAVGGNGSAVDAVAQRAVAVIPVLENEEFPGGGFGGIGPFEIAEGGFRGAAGSQEKHLAAGCEKSLHGFRGGAGGKRRGPEDGGEVRGDGGGGLRGIDALGAEISQSGRRGGEGEVVGGFAGRRKRRGISPGGPGRRRRRRRCRAGCHRRGSRASRGRFRCRTGRAMRFWKRSDWPGRVRVSVVRVPLRWVVSGMEVVPRASPERRTSRSIRSSSPERREPSSLTEEFGAVGPVRERTRMAGFCGSAARLARAAAQRSSSGRQLEDCRSEASQTSERPAVSARNSAARVSRVGKSAAVSVPAVAESSARISGEGISWGLFEALSMSTSRAAPRSAMASRTFLMTIWRRDSRPSPGLISIEAERSNKSTTVSMEPPPQPMRPETMGRAAASASAASARARQVRMRMWRSFFLPRDSRDALSRNCIAAHWMVL